MPTAARMMHKVYKRAFLGNELLRKGDAPIKGRFSWACITGELDHNKGHWFGLIKTMRDLGDNSMSMTDEDIGLSAEEQAQFDAMRETGGLPPGSNIQSPEQLTPPAPPPVPEPSSTAVDNKTQTPTPPPAPEPEDPDVETVRDATGKEVIDARTGKPQKRVSFHKYQRAVAQLEELKKQLATTGEERARIDERLKIINEALTTPEPKEEKSAAELDPEPDPEVNIFEWVKWNKRELQRGSDRHGRTHRRISRINSASRATRSSAIISARN